MYIGSLQVLLSSRELLLDGQQVRIGSRAFDLLEQLILADGKLVSKNELLSRVWPNTIVEENNLQVHMSALRKLLGDARSAIKTVPGRGYRLAIGIEDRCVGDAPDGAPPRNAGRLPASTSALIGRESAIEEVCGLFDSGRQVTLVGAGGIGKTRLGIEVARELQRRFLDGVFFASLASAADTPMALDVLAKAIGLSETNGPITLPKILAKLGQRCVLLVLDNCEHIAATAAELAECITQSNANACILATSQEALRTIDEIVYSVQPLTVPNKNDQSHEVLQCSAVKFFLSRVLALDPQFSSDAQSIALTGTVCRRLDGIPLALELAAARAAVLGIHTLVTLLDDRFRMLTGGYRTALPRHQTLKATLDWSYSLLNEAERLLLRRLSIFVSGFTAEDAPSVIGANDLNDVEIIDALTGLVEKSLVLADTNTCDKRYRMIETTRAYALQKLEDHGEDRIVAGNHARYLCLKLSSKRDDFSGLPQAPARNTFQGDIDDIRTALRWAFSSQGDASIGLSLAAASVDRFYDASLVDECSEWSQRAIQSIAQSSRNTKLVTGFRMRLVAGFAASTVYILGPNRANQECWADVLSTSIMLGDRAFEARALWGLWNAAQYSGAVSEALGYARRFHALAADSADQTNEILSERLLGVSLHYAGDQRAARVHLERVVHAQIGMRLDKAVHHLMVTNATLTRIRWMQGEHDQALDAARQMFDEAMRGGHDMTTCYVLVEAFIPLALLSGKWDAAAQGIQTLAEIATRAGLRIWRTSGRCYEEWLRALDDVTPGRLECFSRALRELEQSGYLAHHGLISGEYALALGRAGRVCEGVAVVEVALKAADDNGEHWYTCELQRIQGELLLSGSLQSPDFDCTETGAEACFTAALEESIRQGSKTFRLRAATSLGKLWKMRVNSTDASHLPLPARAAISKCLDFDGQLVAGFPGT